MAEFRAHGVEGRITTFDIAAIAGVSQSVVSRVLRGEISVPAETRQQITKIAADLGYHGETPQVAARTGTLAVLIFRDPAVTDPITHPFFIAMASSLARAAGARGYDLLISFESPYERAASYCRGCSKSDGVILLGTGDFHLYQRRLNQMVRQGVKFIRYTSARDRGPGPVVSCDNYQGGLAAVRHLISLGRKRIVFAGGLSGQSPGFAERFRGYTHALREVDVIPLPPLQIDAMSEVDSGRAAAQSLLARGVRFDAVFAASDPIAIGVMQALQNAGVCVPGDVSVVGFDDIPAAGLVFPPLTTVRQDTDLAARSLVDALLQLIDGKVFDGQILEPRLIVRGSCGANVN